MKITCLGALALVAVVVLVMLCPSADAESESCQVKVSGSLSVPAVAVFSDGSGETEIEIKDRVVSTFMEPGTYTLMVRSPDGKVYNEREVELGQMASFRFFTTRLAVGNSGWHYGEDYSADMLLNNGKTLYSPVSEKTSGITIVANVGDVADITIVPTEGTVAKGYCPVHRTITLNAVKTVYKTVLPMAKDFRLTVPSGTGVSLGMRAFDALVPFEIAPFTVKDDGEKAVLVYKLIVGNFYGFRVSQDGCADRCCVMMMKSGLRAEITDEQMRSQTPDDPGADAGAAGMLMNVNAEGFLRMEKGDSFELKPQRVTYTEDSKYGLFLAPEFHYRAIRPDGAPSDAVSFEGGTVRAESDGTAFVLVTYDAVHVDYLNVSGMKSTTLGAASGNGTGVVVVTVGPGAGPDMNIGNGLSDVSDRLCGSHFDSDLDVVYYADGAISGAIQLGRSLSERTVQYSPVYEGGALASFKESKAESSDAKHLARVYDGPNVLRFATDDGVSYQVVKASKIRFSVMDLDRGSYNVFVPGDELSVMVEGVHAPASSEFYGADMKLVLSFYGETYVADESGRFDGLVIPESDAGQYVPISLKAVCSGACPLFGSHRNGTEGIVIEDRSSIFGHFNLARYYISDYCNVFMDTMVGEDWDTYATADAGAQGKTVDIGKFQVVAGKKLHLSLNRTSAQGLYGAKSIEGLGDWMTYDPLSSTNDVSVFVAEPGIEDVGTHRFTIVLKLLNNQGTMKTTVTGKIKVLETRTVVHTTCISGGRITIPGIPEGTPVPEGVEFKAWNTEPDFSGTEMKAGTKLTLDSDLHLYAHYGNLDVGSTFICDGLYYTINSINEAGGMVSVTGCTDTYGEDLVVPGTVEYCGITYAVESVGPSAFFGNVSIRTADLSAVGRVGFKSFPYCQSLESVKLSGTIGAYAFYSCYNLQKVEIIGDSEVMGYAFMWCKSLADVTLPENVIFGKKAFGKCTFESDDGRSMSYPELAGHRFTGAAGKLVVYVSGLGEVFEQDGLKYKITAKDEASLIGSKDALIESLIVPDSVRHLGFEYKVTQIGVKAFYRCTTLKSVDLGNATTVSSKAFARCTNLASVDLSGVTMIDSYAFYLCKGLRALEFADGVSIGASAFYKCTGLERMEFKEVSFVGGSAFYGWTFWDQGSGKRLSVNAGSLSNHTFEKSLSKMSLV